MYHIYLHKLGCDMKPSPIFLLGTVFLLFQHLPSLFFCAIWLHHHKVSSMNSMVQTGSIDNLLFFLIKNIICIYIYIYMYYAIVLTLNVFRLFYLELPLLPICKYDPYGIQCGSNDSFPLLDKGVRLDHGRFVLPRCKFFFVHMVEMSKTIHLGCSSVHHT